MTWFFSPIKSTDTSTALCPDKAVLAVSLPVLTAVGRVDFLFSFFHKKDISWVIIRIEIKMKSGALLPNIR